MKTLGQKVAEFRALKGWNTTRMAKEVGTTRQNIEHLEARGNMVPGYIQELAKAMGATVDDLLDNRKALPDPVTPGALTQVAANDDHLKLQGTQLTTLLRAIPPGQQLAAYTAAVEVLLGYVLATQQATPAAGTPAPPETPTA